MDANGDSEDQVCPFSSQEQDTMIPVDEENNEVLHDSVLMSAGECIDRVERLRLKILRRQVEDIGNAQWTMAMISTIVECVIDTPVKEEIDQDDPEAVSWPQDQEDPEALFYAQEDPEALFYAQDQEGLEAVSYDQEGPEAVSYAQDQVGPEAVSYAEDQQGPEAVSCYLSSQAALVARTTEASFSDQDDNDGVFCAQGQLVIDEGDVEFEGEFESSHVLVHAEVKSEGPIADEMIEQNFCNALVDVDRESQFGNSILAQSSPKSGIGLNDWWC